MRAPDFWSRPDPGWQARLLTPLSILYTLGGRARQTFTSPCRAGIPVLCVGNLTLGGSGKTPVAIALCEMLKEAGQTPFFLTRGYGGDKRGPVCVDLNRHTARDVGDEPLLLAHSAPVIVARDRVKGARFAQKAGASMIVMDDGFQNPTLAKDISLIVVDGTAGFGNGRVFPAGPLREPVATGLARADAVIKVGGASQLDVHPRIPIFEAELMPDATEAKRWAGAKVFAFAGIGRPEKFFATLKTCGATVLGTRGFPDHHVFASGEIADMRAHAASLGAALITTQKDFVRLPAALREGLATLPVHARFAAPDAITDFLKKRLV